MPEQLPVNAAYHLLGISAVRGRHEIPRLVMCAVGVEAQRTGLAAQLALDLGTSNNGANGALEVAIRNEEAGRVLNDDGLGGEGQVSHKRPNEVDAVAITHSDDDPVLPLVDVRPVDSAEWQNVASDVLVPAMELAEIEVRLESDHVLRALSHGGRTASRVPFEEIGDGHLSLLERRRALLEPNHHTTVAVEESREARKVVDELRQSLIVIDMSRKCSALRG